MEVYAGEFIQGILNQIPEQNNHEKYLTIFPFTKYHNILLNSRIIQFDENCDLWSVTPLNNIFGAIVINNVLYILFNNLYLHILYKNGEHDVLYLEATPTKIEEMRKRSFQVRTPSAPRKQR